MISPAPVSSVAPSTTSTPALHQPATESAALQVFDTVELLETILFALPTKDLLFAQKVCKHWKGVIAFSSKLQQALFFKNIHDRPLNIFEALDTYVKVLHNPLLVHMEWPMDPVEPGVTFSGSFRGAPILDRSWLGKDASWRRMLATQPATTSTCWIDSSRNPEAVGKELAREQPDDMVTKWAATYEYSAIWGNWKDIHPQKNKWLMGEIVEDLDEMLQLVPDKIRSCSVIFPGLDECSNLRSNTDLVEMLEHVRGCKDLDKGTECPRALAKIKEEREEMKMLEELMGMDDDSQSSGGGEADANEA